MQLSNAASEGLEKLRSRIETIEKQIDDTEDQAQKTAWLLVLVPLLQRENFLLGEQGSKQPSTIRILGAGCMISVFAGTLDHVKSLLASSCISPPAGMVGGVGGGSNVGGEMIPACRLRSKCTPQCAFHPSSHERPSSPCTIQGPIT